MSKLVVNYASPFWKPDEKNNDTNHPSGSGLVWIPSLATARGRDGPGKNYAQCGHSDNSHGTHS
ncbi:hypothetical protein TUM4636_21140 [Shewanella glacialipiscicola]|nr:hypothetical protein TUM4636_21140 [Shewanella glacialipiscicola]